MRVAIEGNIGSGKSSVLTLLEQRGVRVFQEPVADWTELLDLFYMSPREHAFALSMQVLMSFRASVECAHCVVERSPLACRYVFGQMAYNEGLMSQAEWDVFKEYHDLLGWEPCAVIFIDVPADECMKRIRLRARECEARLDLEYVKRVEFQYATLQRYLDVPFVRVDGTRPAEDVVRDVCRELDALGFDLTPVDGSS